MIRMTRPPQPDTRKSQRRLLIALFCLAGLNVEAANIQINVVDGNGTGVPGFRYTVQEDTTFPVNPSAPPLRDEMLSFGFHASNHPPAAAGNSDGTSASVDVLPGRYYVSVLPYAGYAMSGVPVEVGATGGAATVVVEQHPIPTAQIAIFLFEDNYPLNGTPDLPEEENASTADGFSPVDWTNFDIVLEEPAGLYGQNGGPVLQDAFGNPLGTTYDSNGNVSSLGDGSLHPDADGYLVVRNLAPGKYGVIVNPPSSNPVWQQTSTIEGTKVIDAWVKANEPPFFVEFGLPGPHVFVGFVRTDRVASEVLSGGATVSGTITDMHMSRPPEYTFFSGRSFPGCWVALNEGAVAPGRALYAAPCNADGGFSISGVPDGDYQLKVFDSNLDMVIATLPVTVQGGSCNGGSCNFGEVAAFNWFSRLNAAVFNDTNQDGFWDAEEVPVGPEGGPVSLRWRNGTVYQTFATDSEGMAPFDEVFPFFHWLVAEVGFTSKKATGATFVVDAGGLVADNDAFPDFGELTPQIQADGEPWRTETGPVLTQAFQGFLGQTSVMQFGKVDYITNLFKLNPPPMLPTIAYIGETGGISGVVHYATTRAENDPRFAVADTWEPGIPRVQVALYADGDIDCRPGVGPTWPEDDCDIDWDGDGVRDANSGLIADLNKDGVRTRADVDNHPLGWASGGEKGDEDIDRVDDGRPFDYGDALAVTWSDSWDDSPPTKCQGDNQIDITGDPDADDSRCFDGLRNFNQVRPGVFDGGYAFSAYDTQALTDAGRDDLVTKLETFYENRIALTGSTSAGIQKLPDEWILPSDYVVEAAAPVGYKLVKEEDKNVDYGDEYTPVPQAEDVPCIGALRAVPPYLSFATTDGSGATDKLIGAFAPADSQAPFAGDERPLCDLKAVGLTAGQNAATNFFFFTDAPIAANATGMILNDLGNEFNPNSPNFSEKYAPPYVPVAFYDWNGHQVNRVYADEFGRYNAMLPSTYTVNVPMPSGISPNMLVSCMNDAGPIPNPDADGPAFILDPNYKPEYSQFCYTFQYMPGAATYLDTPVLSIASFVNPVSFPVDCEQPTRTPMIASVERRPTSRPVGAPNAATGPFVVAGGTISAPQQIVIRSMGQMSVPNPAWDGTAGTPEKVTRDYRFGLSSFAGSKVELENAQGIRTAIATPGWTQNQITANVPKGLTPGDYQVIVTRGAQSPTPAVESPIGVTLTVGVCVNPTTNARCRGTEHGVKANAVAPYTADELYAIHSVSPAAYPATPIQDAIDIADPADLILVSPGVYEELVIMWKPVKLQGWGAGAVTLNARQVPTEKADNWRAKVEALVADGSIDLLPGQDIAATGFAALGAPLFPTEEGAGIFVAGSNAFPDWFSGLPNRGARVDGLTIVGATQGGGIVVNGYASHLNIGNNRLTGNAGFYGGGIRLGHPTLFNEDNGLNYTDAQNDQVRIHRNLIIKNGGINADGVGGGIGLLTGSDGYKVQKNWVCGNFSQGSGAGIGHLGFSEGGLIEDNSVIFNESFSQASAESGGGIYIGGQPALQPVDGYLVSPGTGSVSIDANLIRGNQAGAGDGGGIRIENVNGADVVASPDVAGPWSDILVFNNMITNNVAGLAGGGVSVENTVSAYFRYNTIANNDSTATTALAFTPGNPNLTAPQPAGFVSRGHSGDFALLMAGTPDVGGNDQDLFSSPELRSNILYNNRSFHWENKDDPATPIIETGLFPADCTPTSTASCIFDDLAVLGALGQLNPVFSVLTDTAGYAASNLSADPEFVRPYFNGPRDNLNLPEFTTLQTSAALDEGGNFIQVTFGPLTLLDTSVRNVNLRTMFDYHLTAGSPAINSGSPNNAGGALGTLGSRDFDNDPRGKSNTDIGADEYTP